MHIIQPDSSDKQEPEDWLEDLQTGNESRDEQEPKAEAASNLKDEEGYDWEVSKVLLTSLYHSNFFAARDQ